MKNQKHFTATAVVHNARGQVLLVYHNQFNRWMCPGGHVEPGELPDEAALREVLEETGLRVRFLPNGEFADMGDAHAEVLRTPFCVLDERIAPGHHHIDLVYRCMAKEGEERPRFDPNESRAAAWFSVDEIASWDESRTFANVRSVILRSGERFRLERG